MAEVNADLERSLEGPVKKFLSRGLFGARPRMSARAFSADASVRGRRSFVLWRLKRHPVAVALVFACAVAALFRLPLVSRAFASVPLVGNAYASFLRQVDLDAAYQAGLLTRLDRTLTKDGLTLNIIDAGVDRDAIVVSFSILPAEEDPSGIWARMDRGEVMVAARIGDYGTATFMQPLNREENRIYGVARAAQPKGWRSLLQNLLGSKVTLSFSACEKEPYFEPPFDQDAWKAGRTLHTWKIEVPIRTVEVEPTVIPINKELPAGITVDRMVLTPWRTVVEYTIRNPEAGNAESSQSWRYLGDCFMITTSDGRQFREIFCPVPENWGGEEVEGEVHFEAIPEGNLSIAFKIPKFEGGELRLPVEEGATTSCFDGEGALKVETIKKLEGGVEVTLVLESELKLLGAEVHLVDGQGRPATTGPYVRYGRDNTVILPFVTDLDSGPYDLEVDWIFASEPEGTVVFEVKVAGE